MASPGQPSAPSAIKEGVTTLTIHCQSAGFVFGETEAHDMEVPVCNVLWAGSVLPAVENLEPGYTSKGKLSPVVMFLVYFNTFLGIPQCRSY